MQVFLWDLRRAVVWMARFPAADLLSADLSEASGVDQRNLNLEEGEMVIRVRRLRFCDGTPTVLEMNHFSQKYAFLFNAGSEGTISDAFFVAVS